VNNLFASRGLSTNGQEAVNFMAVTLNNSVVIDLFAGLGGWSEAFIAEGYRAVGFDIEAHDYGDGQKYPGELVLRDVRSITGADLVREYGVPAVIVASPPCQEFSYMAMPWSKAKEKQRKIEASQEERTRLTDLFNQCFRIQQEVSEAAGHYVPMIVENVRGAQKWVGRAKWNFGSFYLWGDVPALMPIPGKSQHGQGRQSEGQKVEARIYHRDGASHTRHLTNPDERNGTKGFGDFNNCEMARKYGSKSKKRKQASAEIAKIPFALASWIARCFKPQ
jgi:C-5 cytosine-specific DNA methylase